MKRFLPAFLLFLSCKATAQKIDSIYVHLYTDSLKKGTYNYINIDGLLSNGRYLPLDSNDILFTASAGKFYGNTLLVDKDTKEEKIAIKVVLKSNPALHKEFVLYIKKKPDDEKLKTVDELMNDMQSPNSKRKKG
ncbi:hypothetical protein [Ferruginibacter profundus]